MAPQISQARPDSIWELARSQHGVVSTAQLLDFGLTTEAIRHRARRGRLHRLHPSVYAVGRPGLSQRGRWMAAVLACGSGAALSDVSAAQLWGMMAPANGRIHVALPSEVDRRPRGIAIHRRKRVDGDIVERDRIPVTSPTRTLIDLAESLEPRELERAVNEADKLSLVDAERLHSSLLSRSDRGVAVLRHLLDNRTFG